MEKFIKREDMKKQDGYKIVIDRKEYNVSTQFLTGIQIKRIANVTEQMEQIAKATYSSANSMGWFAYAFLDGKGDDQIKNTEEVDLLEQNEFFTACNGTFIINDK